MMNDCPLSVKMCDKRHVIREKKVEYIKREKEVLNILGSNVKTTAPYFVKLYCTFQDSERLCILFHRTV
jgi:3-phosphoinositide dependent protein kinase-1